MLIPFSPYSPAAFPWGRKLGNAANSSCAPVAGPPDFKKRSILALPHAGLPGAVVSAPDDGLALVQNAHFHQWDAQGNLLRHDKLEDLKTEACHHWGPPLWLTEQRVALASPRKLLILEKDGRLTRLGRDQDEDFHAMGGLVASQDGRLLVFAGDGDLHVHFHLEQLSLRLSFRRDGQLSQAGPPLHPPTLYPDGRMVLQHELGCLCCSAMGEVEWWFPGGDLSHPPVINHEGSCGFQDASGRTIFVDSSGTPVNEMAQPLLLAARPRGGWMALGEDALLALDRHDDLLWRLPLESCGLPPVVDSKGWTFLVDAELRLCLVSPQGMLRHELKLPQRPGFLALVAPGTLAFSLGHEVWRFTTA